MIPIKRKNKYINELVPIEFKEIKEIIPSKFVKHCGNYISTKSKIIKKHIPLKYKLIRTPLNYSIN